MTGSGAEGALLLAGENKRKLLMKEGGACPSLALQEKGLSLVAGCWREEENQAG